MINKNKENDFKDITIEELKTTLTKIQEKLHRLEEENKELRLLNNIINNDKMADQNLIKKALRKDRFNLLKYMEIIEVMLVVLNRSGEIVLINRKGCSILGYDENELLGKNWFKTCLPKRNQEEVFQVFQKIMNNEIENIEHYENSIVTKSGQERLISWHNSFDVDESGEICEILSAGLDITERREAEDNLLKERNITGKYLDIIEVMLLAFDNTGKITLINRKGCSILGYDEKELIGQNWFKICIPKNVYDTVYKNFMMIMSNKDLIYLFEYYEYPIVTKTGTECLIAWHNNILTDDAGQIVGLLTAGEDITHRKMVERALHHSNERIKNILSSISDAFFSLDDHLMITYFNHAAEQVLNKRSRDVIGLLLFEAFPELSGSIFDINFNQAVKNKKFTSFETYFGVSPYINWYDVRIYPQENGISVYFQVITERKQIEEALKASEKKYRTLFESASEGILVAEIASQKIRYANPAICKMFGYQENELINFTIHQLHPEASLNWILEEFNSLAVGKKGMVSDIPCLCKNGLIIYADITASQLMNDGIECNVGFFTDITERKKSFEEREFLLNELQRKNKELESIVYAASHDLRSPLVNILGYTQELQNDCYDLELKLQSFGLPDDKKKEVMAIINNQIKMDLHFIHASGKKMDGLVTGLLSLSRLGTIALHLENLDMTILIKRIIETMKYQIDQLQGLMIINKLPYCYGDAGQINQVFSNLIDNAIKYHHPDRILQIEISGFEEGEYSVYCIEDNGIGIHPKYQKKIWDLFYRLDSKNEIPGEGLGLTLVKRIMERHKGKVWVESELNQGCRFYIRLPAKGI